MILVLNPNMALDRVYVVSPFERKSSLKPLKSFLWAGGSGTHAAHIINRWGGSTKVIGFKGGLHGKLLEQQLRVQGLNYLLCPMKSETRSTVSLIEKEHGNLCDVAEFSKRISPSEFKTYARKVRQAISSASLVLFSGSLPEGFPKDFYGSVVQWATRAGIATLGDITGEVLRKTLPHHPTWIKMNREEISQSTGKSIRSVQEAIRAIPRLKQLGARSLLLSLDREGLLVSCAEGLFHLTHPKVCPYNTIGCGDTLFGTFAYRFEKLGAKNFQLTLRQSVAAALANLSSDAPGEIQVALVKKLIPKIKVKQYE